LKSLRDLGVKGVEEVEGRESAGAGGTRLPPLFLAPNQPRISCGFLEALRDFSQSPDGVVGDAGECGLLVGRQIQFAEAR
jgi:hypothetical protein